MEWLTRIVLVATGLVHLLPAAGLLGARQLERLYGVSLGEPNLLLLMRHRALLFGVLGVGLMTAAMVPPLRLPMLLAGLLSTAGYCALAWTSHDLNAALVRVARIDLVLTLALLAALALQLRSA